MVLKKSHFGSALCITLTILFLNCPYLGAQESVEHKVKAAFIHKFIKFTQWPKATFISDNSPIIIGVYGESPIWSGLKNLENKPVMGRRLKILKMKEPDKTKKFQIIFVSKTKKDEVDSLLNKINKSGVMTIGESDGFAEKGGMINFVIVGSKLRFEINVVAIERSGLKLSSKLLRLGKIVKTD
jgi:hypothetical protein